MALAWLNVSSEQEAQNKQGYLTKDKFHLNKKSLIQPLAIQMDGSKYKMA